jgi:hypothetical protein
MYHSNWKDDCQIDFNTHHSHTSLKKAIRVLEDPLPPQLDAVSRQTSMQPYKETRAGQGV